MKTMLGPKYDGQVAEENRFHPSMLSNFLKSLKVSNSVTSEKHFTTRNIFLPCPVLSLGKNGFACGFDKHLSLLWPQWHWKRRHKVHEASVQRVSSIRFHAYVCVSHGCWYFDILRPMLLFSFQPWRMPFKRDDCKVHQTLWTLHREEPYRIDR